MKERSDSNNFNSLTATLIELRTSRCPQHGRLIRITSIPRALIPIVADQPFPQPFPPPTVALYFTFSPTLFGGLGEFALASIRIIVRNLVKKFQPEGRRVYRAIGAEAKRVCLRRWETSAIDRLDRRFRTR